MLSLGLNFISSILKYWKLVLIGLLSIYIVYLNIDVNSKEKTILQLKTDYQKEREVALAKLEEQESKYKDLETKYHNDVAQKQLDNKDKIAKEIKTIKSEDKTKVILLQGKCSNYLKGRYNETNVVTRNI